MKARSRAAARSSGRQARTFIAVMVGSLIMIRFADGNSEVLVTSIYVAAIYMAGRGRTAIRRLAGGRKLPGDGVFEAARLNSRLGPVGE
jgi:hypothetical protein